MSTMNSALGNYCVVRREWSRDALAIWFCQRQMNDQFSVAKPVQLEFVKEENNGFFQLPEPTLILPGPAMKEFYEGLGEQLELNGERFLEARTAIKKQDAHLEDMRKVLDRTLGMLERK
jgi:hypothetical protein